MSELPAFELIAAVQLLLYGIAWAVGSVFVAEERRALLHWAAYALLSAGAAFVAAAWTDRSTDLPVAGLLLALAAFVAAMRGVDLFCWGRATLDRWLLPPVAVLLAVVVVVQWVPVRETARMLLSSTYGFACAFVLLVATARLWAGLQRTSGRVAASVALAPGLLMGLLALVAGTAALFITSAEQGAVRAAARPANVLLSLVVSALFNFSFLFLLVSRFVGRLRYVARHDHLTGVYTRREIETLLADAWHQHRRIGTGLAVAMVDIDHFKAINDRHGHAEGDRALVHAGGVLRERTRPYDRVGRWGGEEFLVLLIGDDGAAAAQTAERLREALAQTADAEAGIALTVSIGVAIAAPGDASPDMLVARADRAMYAAKAAGRDRVVVDGPGPRQAADRAAQAGTGSPASASASLAAESPKA